MKWIESDLGPSDWHKVGDVPRRELVTIPVSGDVDELLEDLDDRR